MPDDGVLAPVRLAELVATLSLAADLGLGQPMEHCLRQTIMALRLADRVGVDESELVAKGLPGDQCHCPRWGYVLKGKVGFRFGDREEIYEAGDASYVPPGHTPFGCAGGEMVLFQPSEEMAKTVETMKRNMEAAEASAAR